MTFIDIFWIFISTAFLFFGSLIMATIPFIVIIAILSYFRNNIIRFDFFSKAMDWIEDNSILLLLILALTIHCAFLSYEEQIDRDAQIRQEGYDEGYKDGYEKGINYRYNKK